MRRRCLLTLGALAAGAARAGTEPVDPPALAESGMPFLATGPDQAVYLSWIDFLGPKEHALRYARWTGTGWSAAETIARGTNWFVNWADLPALAVLNDGGMLAHWLTRSNDGGKYGYGIRMAMKAARGSGWREIHGINLEDREDYAGFLSFVPEERGALYLSPPKVAPSKVASLAGEHHHEEEGHRKTVRYVTFDARGGLLKDVEVDFDACSCCPTSIGRTERGLIAVYRDHQSEIRDIAVIRRVDGRWSTPRTLYPDGWKINACPTEGPSLVAQGSHVGVAWLTRAGGTAAVKFVQSENNGEQFGEAVRIDSGNPLGRPALVKSGDGGWLVVWLEKTTSERNELRIRRLAANGRPGEAMVVARVPAGRGAGMPRIAVTGEQILVAWRDQRVRTALLHKKQLPS